MAVRVWATAGETVAAGPTLEGGNVTTTPEAPMPTAADDEADDSEARDRGRPDASHPGGHTNGRPPSRWKWRWSTVWPPQAPTFETSR